MATWVKVVPSVLVETVYEVMSPSVELLRFHCLGRYSRVETPLHTPPRSIVIEWGRDGESPQVDQQVSKPLSLSPSIACIGPSPVWNPLA